MRGFTPLLPLYPLMVWTDETLLYINFFAFLAQSSQREILKKMFGPEGEQVHLEWNKLLKIELIIYTLHQILFDNKSEEFAGQCL